MGRSGVTESVQLPPRIPDTPLVRRWASDWERDARRARRRRIVSCGLAVIAAGVAGTITLAGSTSVRDTRSAEREIVTYPLPVFVADPDKRELAPTFARWADEYDVSVALVEALTWRESRWDNSQVSSAGAIGIGQLMPATAAFVATELIGESLDVADPEDNIRLSARYLRFLLDRFGQNVRTALAAYVQGATSLGVDGLLPDTVAYVDEVLALRDDFTRP